MFWRQRTKGVVQRGRKTLEGLAREVYRGLPVSPARRAEAKDILFTKLPVLFEGTSAFVHWQTIRTYEATPVRPARADHLPFRLWTMEAGSEAWTRDRDAFESSWADNPHVLLASMPGEVSSDRSPLSPLEVARVRDRLRKLADHPKEHGTRVSIVIPTYNQARLTTLAVESVFTWTSKYDREIVVLDDCSTDGTSAVFSDLPGIVYLRNPRNLGFLRSVNRGAQAATGRYVALLNNDTFVLPAWLDELISPLEEDDSIGLTGSKLIFADGRLQEAGGIIFSDGSGWNYGRYDNPRKPEYNYARECDYASGASVALPKDLWTLLHGFDERYSPAYYEDTDLAFRVRAAGKRVIYSPYSSLFHLEGASAELIGKPNQKRFQDLNRPKFLERWRETLRTHTNSSGGPLPALERRYRGTIVFIDAETPRPDLDSGSIDCFEILRSLVSFGFHVVFVAENVAFTGRYTQDLQKIGVECLYHPFVESFEAAIEGAVPKAHFVFLSRLPIATRTLDIVRKHAPAAKIVFNTVDLHFLRKERQAEIESSQALREEAARDRETELRLVGAVDATVVVSRFERDLLEGAVPGAKVHYIPLLRNLSVRARRPWAERKDVLFIGSYQHPPNVDAVQWLVHSIWPLVDIPGARLRIVGSHMNEVIHVLRSDRISTEGHVPDLEQLLSEVRLTVAPLRYGAGLKGKVISSLVHGVPCISTPVAVEGSDLIHDAHTLVAESPEAFASEIRRAYLDESTWHRLSDQGLELAKSQYSIPAVRARLATLMTELEALRC